MVACLALLCLSYSALTKAQDLVPGQVYSTGDVVLPTNQGGPSSWVNGVYQDRLTCWSWGDPGYCGPNAIVRPGNNINFSYGQTDLYQSQVIANILPTTGSGLRVDGYNFGFTAKNGNGWDDGRQDMLSAYVHLTNPNNQVVEYKAYNLNYRFNWTTFNFSETFTTPYAVKDLNRVTYGFVGRDNNSWAGPYGPEVMNVNFSLKYSVDPCASNVLSSPSCPGYLDAIGKYSSSSSTPSTTPEPIQAVVAPATSTITTPSSSPVTIESSTISSQAPVASSTTSAPVTVVASTTASVTPSATNPQPKIGEVSVAGSQSSSRSTVSTSQILSIIGSEQSRLSRLEMSTVATTTEQAKQDAAKVIGEAQSVAATQQAQTLAASQLLGAATGPQQSSGNGLQLNSAQAIGGATNNSMIGLTSNQFNFQSSSFGLQVGTTASSSYTAGIELTSSARRYEQDVHRQQSVEQPNDNKQLFSATNPLNAAINPTVNLTPPSQPSTGSSVNRNAQPNDAAGGRDIGSIATTPVGFDSYMQLALRDGNFYKPHEVYRGQVNVDNQRALRQLSSDRLHREMVDQQYKR